MVVGPEAAGSLLVGTVVRTSVDRGNSGDEDETINSRIAGVVTGMAGAVILTAGLTRLGFLDSVLSRPFLRGFISAIGFVILVNELIPELGLTNLSKEAGISHGTSFDKLIFICKQAGNAHGLTCAVAFGSFAIIMICRTIKKRLQPHVPSVAYIPDRFLIVALSAVCAWGFSWDKKGLSILGDVQSSTGSPFPFQLPFIPSHMNHIREAMGTSFLIALLGFFESSVAAKALGDPKPGEGIQGMSLSANRELVALGFSNIVGGCFMALPAFGGYGRSKVNASTGGRTPMSSVILSLITVVCILFLLPYFYYIPVRPYFLDGHWERKADKLLESCTECHDKCGSLLFDRRVSRRHQVLYSNPRLVRADAHVSYLRRHNTLLLATGSHSWYGSLRSVCHQTRHEAKNSNSWQSSRHNRSIRECGR